MDFDEAENDKCTKIGREVRRMLKGRDPPHNVHIYNGVYNR